MMAAVSAQCNLDSEQQVPVTLFKKRANKSLRRRPASPLQDAAADSISEYSSDDDAGHRVKRRRKNGVEVALPLARPKQMDELEPTKFAADRSTSIEATNTATKQSNWYDEAAPDGLSERNLLGKGSAHAVTDASAKNTGTYRGVASYTSFVQKNPDAPNRQVGPMKAPMNIRTITITDMSPDVCKDYKQTGFCGFGDSCKFLHAREDYKQGWELDRDWEIGTKGKKLAGKTVASANRSGLAAEDTEAAEDAELEKIPFACIICKEAYKNPIQTKCSHYFCEKCALDRYRKKPDCAACGADTRGVFNNARRLKELLAKKMERAQKRKEELREDGEDIDEVEEGI